MSRDILFKLIKRVIDCLFIAYSLYIFHFGYNNYIYSMPELIKIASTV